MAEEWWNVSRWRDIQMTSFEEKRTYLEGRYDNRTALTLPFRRVHVSSDFISNPESTMVL
jgi:hypothetical protein